MGLNINTSGRPIIELKAINTSGLTLTPTNTVPSLELRPLKNKGIVFEFINKGSGSGINSNFVRCTKEAYNAMPVHNSKTIYFVTDNAGQLIEIYLGLELIQRISNIDNIVVLTEEEYESLNVKDPLKFYYTYEDEENKAYIEGNKLILSGNFYEGKLTIKGSITDNKLIL